jgi:MYXO-CTERM domain-containing protein
VRQGPVYPDANGTLRFSYATVKGYEPADGVIAKPQTTLRGAVDKHTGEPPFALPAAVIEKAPAARDSYWADADLGDVPVCFLTNADTTGGNSGSPIIDGQGRLVGLNFDRVWENIAGDFGYSQERSRNIGVDVRYLLWMLDRVDNASALLTELGVAEHRGASVQRSRAGARRPTPGAPAEQSQPAAKTGCGCSVEPRDPSAGLWALGLVALALGRRARARSAARPHA